jgi:lipoate-protein ligase A
MMSNSPTLRALPFSTADGPENMAVDEVMLESALEGLASIRLYAWQVPTLSLGYFQRHQDRLADNGLAALPWVRRSTGGGAILHSGDLTYAIALPPDIAKSRKPADWHCRIHHALAKVLQQLGVDARVLAGQRESSAHPAFLCFADPQPGDVLLASQKIVGGAQRVRAGALLQHGSIQHPIAESQRGPLFDAFVAALGWQAMTAPWTTGETDRIRDLVQTKYGTASWNCRR